MPPQPVWLCCHSSGRHFLCTAGTPSQKTRTASYKEPRHNPPSPNCGASLFLVRQCVCFHWSGAPLLYHCPLLTGHKRTAPPTHSISPTPPTPRPRGRGVFIQCAAPRLIMRYYFQVVTRCLFPRRAPPRGKLRDFAGDTMLSSFRRLGIPLRQIDTPFLLLRAFALLFRPLLPVCGYSVHFVRPPLLARASTLHGWLIVLVSRRYGNSSPLLLG